MKHSVLGTAVLLSLVGACASTTQPEPTTPEAPAAEPAAEPVATAPAANPEPAPAAPAAPPAPTAEELARAEALAALQKERAELQAQNQAELARFTPELRAEYKALAEKSWGGTPAALKTIMKSSHRKPGNAERDKARHPVETLQFFGVKPASTVLEYGPGDGWYTELLAPLLATKGKLIVTNGDPKGPADQRSTFYAERTQLFLDRLPEVYGKVETVTVDSKAPDLKQEGTVDVIMLMRGAHGMVNQGTLNAWLAEAHEALKPKGVLGIEQHRAKDDADPIAAAKTGYLPEKWLIQQVEAAGFKLQGKSKVNANPKDTKDHPHGVWSLPPTLRGGEQDKAKYEAIGESDRMTLKFVKVEQKKPAAAAGAAADASAPGAAKSGAASAATAPAAAKGATSAAAPTAAQPATAAKPTQPAQASAAQPAQPATAAKSAQPATAAKPAQPAGASRAATAPASGAPAGSAQPATSSTN